MTMHICKSWAGVTVLAMILSLQGCSGGEDTTSKASQIVVNTPAMLAQVSADNYDLNSQWLDHRGHLSSSGRTTGSTSDLQASPAN